MLPSFTHHFAFLISCLFIYIFTFPFPSSFRSFLVLHYLFPFTLPFVCFLLLCFSSLLFFFPSPLSHFLPSCFADLQPCCSLSISVPLSFSYFNFVPFAFCFLILSPSILYCILPYFILSSFHLFPSPLLFLSLFLFPFFL